MLRTALTPRFLGLLALALVVAAVFVQLGRWQLGVAENRGQIAALEQAREAATVPLTEVLQPHSAFPGKLSTRNVTVAGHYADGQLLVPGRRLGGRTGAWVLTPFVVDAGGATLPVVRGFVLDADADATGPPPAGTITLTGGLAPSESPAQGPSAPGEIGSVDTSVLVNTWPGDLYNAFVFLQQEQPTTGDALTRVPVPVGSAGVNGRNAAYAVQWWVFALFALWLWWRTVREEHRKLEAVGTTGRAPRGAPRVLDGPGGASTPGRDPRPDDAAPTLAGDNGVREHL